MLCNWLVDLHYQKRDSSLKVFNSWLVESIGVAPVKMQGWLYLSSPGLSHMLFGVSFLMCDRTSFFPPLPFFKVFLLSLILCVLCLHVGMGTWVIGSYKTLCMGAEYQTWVLHKHTKCFYSLIHLSCSLHFLQWDWTGCYL